MCQPTINHPLHASITLWTLCNYNCRNQKYILSCESLYPITLYTLLHTMKKILTLALIFTLVGVTHGYEPDYFILALQWSPALFRDENCVVNKIDDRFMIHGLWPADRYKISPTFCEENPFDELKVSLSLYTPMNSSIFSGQ